jgi:hypothetical protein
MFMRYASRFTLHGSMSEVEYAGGFSTVCKRVREV